MRTVARCLPPTCSPLRTRQAKLALKATKIQAVVKGKVERKQLEQQKSLLIFTENRAAKARGAAARTTPHLAAPLTRVSGSAPEAPCVRAAAPSR